jgi:hypothetical protein
MDGSDASFLAFCGDVAAEVNKHILKEFPIIIWMGVMQAF